MGRSSEILVKKHSRLVQGGAAWRFRKETFAKGGIRGGMKGS